jgi:hypothetical protein
MPRLFNALAGLSLASVALSSPLNARQYGTGSPCAAVSAAVATQKAVATPTVPAQLAYDCITSVPFNQSAALALVDGVVPYFKWQSNTVWLKDPPAEYAEKVQPGIDVWGGLEEIRSKVVGGKYESEYEVCSANHNFRTTKANPLHSLDSNFTSSCSKHTTVISYTYLMSLAMSSTSRDLSLLFQSQPMARSCQKHTFMPIS